MDRSSVTPATTRLCDYSPPAIDISAIDLRFEIDGDMTRVVSTMDITRRDRASTEPIVLFGDELTLESISVDTGLLEDDQYAIYKGDLHLAGMPEAFRLQICNTISPAANNALMGLYESSGNLCTQCEAEGFRRITWFPDRPDVLTSFTTTLVGDRSRYPVLLSNGNLIDSGELADNRHYATWHDPWPKPSYLFALVAGQLAHIEDAFTTRGGREVTLRLYVEPHNANKCDHAMAALIKSMRWDEDVYGREYDLDVYNIVAVDDFNMGAMENKGLNVFNSKYVLASPETATDTDYQNIESVIAHEYFHNWSGNRVTCRDWFQLSLKEGFTVFRDQEFSADTFSRGVKRIEDVNILRTHQFREDAGPIAHPVRPDSYVEINNFYTATVYNKGAEVVRMLHRLVGADGFRKGTDLYFDRHDGQAVTIEDFIRAMENANDCSFDQFRRWYSQAGTPRLRVRRYYDELSRELTIDVTQSCPDTPGQSNKAPFHMPLTIALLDSDGHHQTLKPTHPESLSAGDSENTGVLNLTEAHHRFVFRDASEATVPSLLRGFSAPVIMDDDLSFDELAFLMNHDDDPFNRWEAAQKLASDVILDLANRERTGPVPGRFVNAWGGLLASEIDDLNFKAEALRLPSEIVLAEKMSPVNPDALQVARASVMRELAMVHATSLRELHLSLRSNAAFSPDPQSAGRRSLANLCLSVLSAIDSPESFWLARNQFDSANNMTDELAALTCIAHGVSADRCAALDDFLERHGDDSLVVDKWLRTQATSPALDTLDRVKALTTHPVYNDRNPNKVYSLIGAFAVGNPARFHAAGGGGYQFLADTVIHLDSQNPQVAARMTGALTTWRRYDSTRQAGMRAALERILDTPELSPDVYELVSKSLADPA